jgi:hypothetical protein
MMTHADRARPDALAVVARQRTVLTTVADVIVATVAGRGLLLTVGYAGADQADFVDLLEQALHARGRPCHRLPPGPAADRHDGTAGLAVLTSPPRDGYDSDVCRISVELCAAGQIGTDRHSAHIVVDFSDPAGPRISYLADPDGPALGGG